MKEKQWTMKGWVEEKIRIASYRSYKPLPRSIRKLIAKSFLHRAWLSGHSGSFLIGILERS
ncbi:hypothetical protein M3914_003363 [Vibrio metschnikovii]|nr:hypothetical protein [Vibrio metschnikovii]